MVKRNPPAPCLACFGTGSDVGKSVLATALCRLLKRRGGSVAPFKAQNMSNNSGVTPEGLEMGRAQIVQAEACGLPPHVDMNPILLKPTTDVGSQVVVMGRAGENLPAATYHERKAFLWDTARAALDRLRAAHGAVVIEGAGSCAEVNLMPHDIVNFRVAEYADAPVILIADIHRGGVFAQLVGTLECLSPAQRDRVAGFLVNRFRGDIRLFDDGVSWIERRTGKPVFGVIPWFSDFVIEAEDSVVIENPVAVRPQSLDGPAVAVIRLPHVSNFTDIDPLRGVDGLRVCFLESPQSLAGFAAVILPGSKNTRHDLEWLVSTGWNSRLRTFAATGGRILGICGGYQLLGRFVHDPDGLEGPAGSSEALGLLPVETELKAPKTTTLSVVDWDGATGEGYEIHMGQTRRVGASPWFSVTSRNGLPPTDDGLDGCVSDDGRIMGTYLHGLFDAPAITRKWLSAIGLGALSVPDALSGPAARQRAYDRLADHVSTHADVERMLGLISP